MPYLSDFQGIGIAGSIGQTSNANRFFAQQPHTSNTLVDKKDSGFNEILDDLFMIGAKNLKRMGQENFQNSICEQDVVNISNLEEEETQVEDVNDVTQPLIPKTIHTTPPNKDYVAPTTKSILDELLEEFGDEILSITMVDREADFNLTKDIEELQRVLAKNPQSLFTEIQVHSVIIKPKPFTHTQPVSPLYGVIKSSKSSTNPYKVDMVITSPECFADSNSMEMGLEVASNRYSAFIRIYAFGISLSNRSTGKCTWSGARMLIKL
ncbi:hypothetical protein Tco_0999493 [Tanacetum coccineum]